MHTRPMYAADLDFAAGCTAAEGWLTEIRTEFEGYLAHDAGGCLLAEEGGEPVGICVATPYHASGFVGELIVLPRMRGQGVGRRLLEAALAHLHGRGVPSVLLDGVPAAVPLYERVGFRKVCRSLRLAGPVQGRRHEGVRPLRMEDLGAVAALDRALFGEDRSFFLARRLSLYPQLCRVLERDGAIAGYLMGRPAAGGVSAGPWVVARGAARAADLLESLPPEGDTLRVSAGVLETNVAAVATLSALGFGLLEDPPWRMVFGPSAALGAAPEVYSIGSAAKG